MAELSDDLDELLTKGLERAPASFLAHPRAIAAFGREMHAPRRPAADRDAVRSGDSSPGAEFRSCPSDKIKIEGSNGSEGDEDPPHPHR